MKIWKIIFLIIITSSCQNENNCKNEEYLIRPSKNDVIIKLDYNQSQKRLIENIEDLFKENICWKDKVVGLKIKDKILKTIFLKTCLDGII